MSRFAIMKNLLSKIILITLLIFSFNKVFSQTETDSIQKEQIVIVKMKNGDEYRGVHPHHDHDDACALPPRLWLILFKTA